jgi:hypothetical protein
MPSHGYAHRQWLWCVVTAAMVCVKQGAHGWTTAELKAMPRGGSPCVFSDPFACWGNGHCTEQRDDGSDALTPSSSCVCTPGWTGYYCTVLDLAPGPANGAIRRKGWSTWGGSPIVDDGAHLLPSFHRQVSHGSYHLL